MYIGFSMCICIGACSDVSRLLVSAYAWEACSDVSRLLVSAYAWEPAQMYLGF